MNLVPPGPAALAGVVLFLVPGLCFLALLSRGDREALAFDEAAFLAVAGSVAGAAWTGLLLAELGRFSLLTAAAVLALASLAGLVLGRRRLAWPFPPPSGWKELAPGLVVLALAVGLDARPTEYLVGGRDPGTYVAAMALIGRSGGIVYTDPTVLAIPPQDVELFYRNPAAPDFSWGRFMGFPLERPQTGRVVPEFFHLFPSFGAYLFQAMGVKGALAAPPVFGILGTFAAFLVFRRLFGAPTALLAALLLVLNEVQVWFARYPVSEPMSQFLVFLGLLAFAHWEERGSPAFGLLAGFALGLSLLVRIDSVLLALPLLVYLLIRRAHRDLPWRTALPLLLPFLLLLGHAGIHGALFARKYLLSIANRPYWRQPLAVWMGVALLVVALAVAVHLFGPLLVRWLEAHGETLRLTLMIGIAGLALYAYFLRPWLSIWAGADGNDPQLALPDGGWLVRRGFDLLAAHDAQAFLRLGWFVTPVGLWLGVLGLLLALRQWSGRLLFPVLLVLSFSLFYFYKIRVWNDYYFALRRFVPVILPFLLGFGALFLTRMAAGGRWRRWLAGAIVLLLVGCFLRGTLPLVRYRDWPNAVRFVDDVARRFGPDDVVIFEQAQSIHLLSLPLWAVHGKNVLELARFKPDPVRLKHLVETWQGRYKSVYFVQTYRSGSDFCGIFLEQGERFRFGSFEWERAYDARPRGPQPRALEFTVSRVVPPEVLQVPALPEVDIGGSDDVQVSGFFDKEGGGDLTYRWTSTCASVYLPGARPGATLLLRVGTGQQPLGEPVKVKVSLSDVLLGEFETGSEFADHALRLPTPLPPGPPVLRLQVPSWRPANALPGATDTRDLGVMVDRVRVIG